MPMQRDKYPKDWARIAYMAKVAAGWKCQVCGKQCRAPEEPFDTHKNTLTVMHLNHDEGDCSPENLMCACAPCHLRYDSRAKAEAKRNGGRKTTMIELDLERARKCRN